METTNPAGRLHVILSKANEHVRSKQTASAGVVWADVFGIDTKQGPEWEILVVEGILQLKKLIEETEEALLRVDGLTEKYFRPFERIRKIPYRSITALSSDIRSEILAVSDGDMTVLEFCSERLDGQHAEPIIDEKELQDILQEVTDLFNEVKKADLEPVLQTFMLDGLESLRRGIIEFRIRGPQRLKEAIAEIIASFVMNHEITKTPQDQESWARFNKTFRRFVAAVSFAHSGIKLLEVVTGPLLPGASAVPH